MNTIGASFAGAIGSTIGKIRLTCRAHLQLTAGSIWQPILRRAMSVFPARCELAACSEALDLFLSECPSWDRADSPRTGCFATLEISTGKASAKAWERSRATSET